MTCPIDPPVGAMRLDVALVRRALSRSRSQARELVTEAAVRVDGVRATKPSTLVSPDAELTVDAAAAVWVGRGARKLEAGLADFGIEVLGRRCLDVGASTGGFTQVLLRAGARHVVALDVGRAQLASELRTDARVTDVPETDIREVDAAALGRFDLVVADLSFISVTLVAPQLARLLASGGDLVVLVKPQFEVGRARLGKGGIVRSPALRGEAVRTVCRALVAAGIGIFGLVPSPLRGASGNREYLVWGSTRDIGRLSWPDVLAQVERMEASE